MNAANIDLIEPIAWFERRLTRLVLKAPTGIHYMKFGEPRFLVRMSDGGAYWVEKDDVIAQYVDALLTLDGASPIDGGDAILRALSLPDVMQIRGALFDFFTDAQGAISTKKSKASSSISASLTPTSPAA
jgi:hypothetical protein